MTKPGKRVGISLPWQKAARPPPSLHLFRLCFRPNNHDRPTALITANRCVIYPLHLYRNRSSSSRPYSKIASSSWAYSLFAAGAILPLTGFPGVKSIMHHTTGQIVAAAEEVLQMMHISKFAFYDMPSGAFSALLFEQTFC